MQYQHLVFEEFARKVQPMVNSFAGYHTEIDPAIVAEFAHTVYRFGHSMLSETVARTSATGDEPRHRPPRGVPQPACLRRHGGEVPEHAAGKIIRGMTRQAATRSTSS